MKALKTLVAIALSTVTLGSAVAIGVAAGSKSVESVEAASTACDVYFKASWSGANITQVKVHYWNGGDYWMNMTEVYTDNGAKVYKYTIPAGNSEFQYQTYTSNWGSGEWHTSVNKTVSNNLLCWPTQNWDGSNFSLNTGTAYPYTINYYGNGNTSGSMTSDKAYGNVQWGLKANAFAKTGYVFAGWNTRADGGGTSYGNQALVPTKTNTNTLNLYAQWTYPSGRYITGKFGSCSWGIDGAVQMTNTGSQYEGQVTLEFGDKIKCAYFNGSSLESYYGYSSTLTTCGAYQYFTNDADDNLVCYARGTYNLYFRDTEYSTGKKLSIELSGSMNAEHLAAKLMGFGEWAGHCGDNDRFPAMKTIYLGLSSEEQSTFQGYASSDVDQFKNAYERYTAWASALGENPWAEGKASYIRVLSGSITENGGAPLIIVVLSMTLVGSFAGYYFLRKKRKEQ